ncbi:TPA: hypothetical protein I8Y21_004093 [Klebsiella oxytoca]|uniref:Uncharacterized protein n=1 Tax=Klebsiella oxytoca TaxID=571 RepID=A0AAN5LAI6_KLEOX|nr:hypothetical protein [Klebsiella oxytoca]
MIYTIETRSDLAEIQRKLSLLDATVLANELARLAVYCQPVTNIVLWLTSTPAENMARFKSRLENMASAKYSAFCQGKEENVVEDLQALLRELQAGATSDREEMEGLLQICQTDNICFEQGHYEGYELSVFYCENLSSAFAECAERLTDCQGLVQTLNALLRDDRYGVRDSMLTPALKILALKA